MKNFLRNNGLSLALFGLFALFVVGQAISGFNVYLEDQASHGQATISMSEYLGTGHFGEAIFENWESEFLQMGAYVLMTIWLFQKGAAESKNPAGSLNAPGKKDGKGKKAGFLYRNSLSFALFSLFFLTFIGHGIEGTRAYNEEEAEHGGETVSVGGYMSSSQFWFESFQNWQSEFLAIGSMLVLSIYLRQQGSPQSKQVSAPNSKTGTE